MSMQQYPRNPIEQRKRAVRTYFRNGGVSVAGGVAGGILLSIITQVSFWLFLGMIIAVVGGFVNYRRVRRIINHRD